MPIVSFGLEHQFRLVAIGHIKIEQSLEFYGVFGYLSLGCFIISVDFTEKLTACSGTKR